VPEVLLIPVRWSLSFPPLFCKRGRIFFLFFLSLSKDESIAGEYKDLFHFPPSFPSPDRQGGFSFSFFPFRFRGELCPYHHFTTPPTRISIKEVARILDEAGRFSFLCEYFVAETPGGPAIRFLEP